MKINSASAEAIGYGTDAIKAFNQAVENGQARLALYVLVDIIDVLIEKIETLESSALKDKIIAEPQKEEIAVDQKEIATEEPKVQAKAKTSAKEVASE